VSGIKRDVLANLAGNVWTALMSIGLVPVYIHFIGIEAYGLVGLFATLQVVFGMLDLGLSTTLNREMARLSGDPANARDMRDLVRTLEIVYWIVGGLIGIALLGLAPCIASKWVQAKQLPTSTVTMAIAMMGCITLVQWPSSLYTGGLFGIGRQVLFNGVAVFTITVRGLGALFVLWFISPTVQAFFIWQAVMSACHTLLVRFFLWGSLPVLPQLQPARFNKRLLKSIWHFAAGTTGLSLQGIIMTQQDKIVLSKLASLETFGYYTFASSVAQGLGRLISPITTAIFPRFAQMSEKQDEQGLARLYHQSCQVLAVLILPAMSVLALFSREILRMWTRNAVTVENTHLLLTILAVGMALNTAMYVPSALQTASGWLSLALRFNTVSVLVFVPLTIMSAYRYGAIGVATMWVAYNMVQILILPHFIHRRLLRDQKWIWYGNDVLLPFLAAMLPVLAMRSLNVSSMPEWELAGCVVLAFMMALVATCLAARDVRTMLWNMATHMRSGFVRH
jgi:O-antigen/teichoic acid export membrane protein